MYRPLALALCCLLATGESPVLAAQTMGPQTPNGTGEATGTQLTPNQLAANCSFRADLANEQETLAAEVANERLALRDLYSQFQQSAAQDAAWSSFGNAGQEFEKGTNEVLDKLDDINDVLDKAKPPVEGPGETIPEISPELDLGNYITIAKGAVAWTTDIMKLSMSAGVNRLDQSTMSNLQALQSMQKTFSDNIDHLHQVNQALVILRPCDSTKLVVNDASSSTAASTSSSSSDSPVATAPPEQPASTPASKSMASNGSSAGKILVTTGLLLGGAAAAGIALGDFMKNSTTGSGGSVSGQCTNGSLNPSCSACTCPSGYGPSGSKGLSCPNTSQCGGGGSCFIPTAPFC